MSEPANLNYILERGDQLHKGLNTQSLLSVPGLPSNAKIEAHVLTVEILEHALNTLDKLSLSSNSATTSTGLIFTVNKYSFALTWDRHFIYLTFTVDIAMALYPQMVEKYIQEVYNSYKFKRRNNFIRNFVC